MFMIIVRALALGFQLFGYALVGLGLSGAAYVVIAGAVAWTILGVKQKDITLTISSVMTGVITAAGLTYTYIHDITHPIMQVM